MRIKNVESRIKKSCSVAACLPRSEAQLLLLGSAADWSETSQSFDGTRAPTLLFGIGNPQIEDIRVIRVNGKRGGEPAAGKRERRRCRLHRAPEAPRNRFATNFLDLPQVKGFLWSPALI